MTGEQSQTTGEQPVLVYTQKSLARMVAHLSRQPAFALDTESNSFYAYYPKVCLIQITTFDDSTDSADSGTPGVPGAPDTPQLVDYLVDPLRLDSLDALSTLVAEGTHEVVMHAAENDVLQLQRDFGMRFRRIFDTQLAARILGWEKVGLAPLLEEHFGAISDKRMQRTDWTTRPLSAQQIAYAAMDTHYLLAMRDLLTERLHEAGRWEEAQEAFAQLAEVDADDRTPQPRTFWQMKVSHSVDLKHSGVLEALWQWREQEAQRLNRPPFKVMSDESLAALATLRPRTTADLNGIASLNPHQIRRYGASLVAAVLEGTLRPLPELPRSAPRPELLLSPADQARFEKLRRWRTETARRRGVGPEIVFSNDTLLEIVQRSPATEAELLQVSGIGPWKAGTYGRELFALLNGHPE